MMCYQLPGSGARPIDTILVYHEVRDMKRNVTVVLDEDTARWVRVEAAKADVSVSQYLGDMLQVQKARADGYGDARASFMGRPPRPLRRGATRLPTRDEVHERLPGRGRGPREP